MFSLKCLFLFIILFPNMTEIQVNVMKMVFIKEESEDVKIEEAFRVKHEDIDTQTGLY